MQKKTFEKSQFEQEFKNFIVNLSTLFNHIEMPTGLKNIFTDIQMIFNDDSSSFNYDLKNKMLSEFFAKELRFFNQDVFNKYPPKKTLKIGSIILESIKEFINHPILNVLHEVLKIAKVFSK